MVLPRNSSAEVLIPYNLSLNRTYAKSPVG